MLMTIAYAFTALRYAPTSMMLPSRFVRFAHRLAPTTAAVLVCRRERQGERERQHVCLRDCVSRVFAGRKRSRAKKNGYTMDVVIASYVTPLLWHW